MPGALGSRYTSRAPTASKSVKNSFLTSCPVFNAIYGSVMISSGEEMVAQTRCSRSKLGGDVLSSRFVIRHLWRAITSTRFMIPIVLYGLMMSCHFHYGCFSQNEHHLVANLSASPFANSSPSGPKPIVILDHASRDVQRAH